MKRHLADFPSEYGSSPRVDSYYGNVATVVTAAATTSSSSLIRSPHLLGGPRLDSFYSSTPKAAGSVAAGGTSGSVVVQRGGSVVTSTPSQRNHNNHDHHYQNSQQNKDPSSKGVNSPNEGPLPSRHFHNSVLTPLRSTSDAIASTTTEKELDFYRRRCEALLDVTLEYRQVIDNLQQQQKERLNETAAPPAVPESPPPASSSITPALNDTKPSTVAAAAREPPRESPLFLQWTSSLQQLSVECTTAKVELWCQTVVSHAASLPRQEQSSNMTKHAADDDVLAEDVGQQCAAILQTIDSVLPQ